MKSSNYAIQRSNEVVPGSSFLSPINNLIFWALYFCIDYFSSLLIEPDKVKLIPALFNFFFVLSFFYGTLLLVFPSTFPFKNKLSIALKFILFMLIIIQTKYFLTATLFASSNQFSKFFMIELIRCFHFSILAALVCFITIAFKKLREKYKLQLAVHQAQLTQYQLIINPHFIANGLNAIHADFISDNKKAKDNLTEFTDILNYCFANENKKVICLTDELTCISKFISFQKLRYGKKLHFNLTIEDPENLAHKLEIPKMTLLTLVENVFKHGLLTDPSNTPNITIQLSKINKQAKLDFKIKNTVLQTSNYRESSKSGITSVSFILKSYFPNSHHLTYFIDKNIFTLNLTISYDQEI